MPDQYQRPYVESSVFIGWIKGEIYSGVDRGQIGSHILTLAEQGHFKIVVSALTLAEVHKKRRFASLDPTEDERILEFFEHDYIEVVTVDRGVGEQANRFCRQYSLSPADAVHLACAIRAGCDVLLTWDAGLIAVQHPNIRVEEPQMLGQLSLNLPGEADPSSPEQRPSTATDVS